MLCRWLALTVVVAYQPEQCKRDLPQDQCQDEHSFMQMPSLHHTAMPKEAGEGILHAKSSFDWRQLWSRWWAPLSLWLAVISCLAVVQLCAATREEVPKKPTANASQVLLGSLQSSPHARPVEKLSEELSWSCAAVKRSWQLQRERHGQDASLGQALLWHSLVCRGISASVFSTLASFGLTLLAFTTNWVLPAFSLEFLLAKIEEIRRLPRQESLQDGLLILGICAGLPVLGAFLEMKIQARHVQFSAHISAALTALLSHKALHLPAEQVGREAAASAALASAQLVAEALSSFWRCCVCFLQVVALLTLLWMKISFAALLPPLGFFPFLLLTSARLRSLVPRYVAYETAARKRVDLLKMGCHRGLVQSHEKEAKLAEMQALRQEELDAAWNIQNSSLQVVSLMARWPRLLVLSTLGAVSLVVESWLPPLRWEETFSVFLLLQSLLRQLSLLNGSASKIFSAQPALAELEDYLQRSELPASLEHLQAEDHLGLCVTGSFAWDEELAPPVLLNMDIKVLQGSFVAVLGTSGAGKTSLMHAALGALRQLPGAAAFRSGSAMLLPSKPWLFQGSLCENVVCGKEFDKERYTAAIKAASLEEELEAFDDSAFMSFESIEDLPERLHAQVAMARAAFGLEELIFVDDPMPELLLPSLEALSGPLFAGRTRLISLNCLSIPSVELLQGFDSILILQSGSVVASGPPDDVLQSEAFQRLPIFRGSSQLAGDLLLMTGKRTTQNSPQHKSVSSQSLDQDESEGISELTATFKLVVFGGAGTKLAMLTVLILANQASQFVVDWVLIDNFSVAFAGKAQSLSVWLQGMAALNFLLSVAIAAVAADCFTTATQALASLPKLPSGAIQEHSSDLRLVDLGMFHEAWRVLTAACCCICMVVLIQIQLGLDGMLLFPAYTAALGFLWAAYRTRTSSLSELEKGRQHLLRYFSASLAAGATGTSIQLTDQQDGALQSFVKQQINSNLLPLQWLTLRLSVCISAVYTLIVLILLARRTQLEAVQLALALTPCVLLMQSVTLPLDIFDAGEAGKAARRLLSRLQLE